MQGSRELRARLRAIGEAFKPIGREWADITVEEARRRVPERTGRLKRSIRRRNASKKRATVVGHFSANFVDAGTKEHVIKAKGNVRLIFNAGGQTIFAKRVNHPATRAKPFKREAGTAALAKTPMAEVLIDLWNRAA